MCRIEEQIQTKMENQVENFKDLLILSYVYLIVITIAIFAQIISVTCSLSISRICKCCKYERSVRSRSSYSLKQGFHWIFLDNFILSYVYLILITIVIFTHRIRVTCSLSRSVFCNVNLNVVLALGAVTA